MPERPGFLRRFFLGLWRLLDFSRRLVLNVLFLAVAVVLLIAWFSGDTPPRLQADTALVLNLQGDLVEEYTIGPREAAIAEALGEQRFETRLRDVLDAIDHAARDPEITRAVLVLDEMGRGGQATLREIAAALERFKASGKPVIAWGESFSQPQYYLAAQANELYMHPGGMLAVHGTGRRASLLQESARQARRADQCVPGWSLQEFRRTFHADRAVAGGPRSGRLPAERAVVDLDRRRRARAQVEGRDHQRRHRGSAAAARDCRRRRCPAGIEGRAGRRSENARRVPARARSTPACPGAMRTRKRSARFRCTPTSVTCGSR